MSATGLTGTLRIDRPAPGPGFEGFARSIAALTRPAKKAEGKS